MTTCLTPDRPRRRRGSITRARIQNGRDDAAGLRGILLSVRTRASQARPRRLVPLLAGLLVAAGAVAEPPANDYIDDVGTVYGAMRGVKQMYDVCTEVFPATEAANRAALIEWRDRYEPFVVEMETRWHHLLAAGAGHDKAAYDAAVAKFEQGFTARTAEMAKTLAANSRDALAAECNSYPAAVRSPQVNFEQTLGAEVTRIRAALPELPGQPAQP